MATLKEGLEEIVRALKDNLDLLSSSGVHSIYSREASLEELAEETALCKRCSLHAKRSGVFFGAGDHGARVVFVAGLHPPSGGGGGAGGPFEGEEGGLLRKIINAMDLKEEEVYVAYALKCAPEKETGDLEEALSECAPILRKELKALSPDVVVALGPLACRALLGDRDVKRIRGRFHDYHGMKVMPTYAPELLLEKEELKSDVWNDMKKVMAELKKA